jgi:hypothetical protein
MPTVAAYASLTILNSVYPARVGNHIRHDNSITVKRKMMASTRDLQLNVGSRTEWEPGIPNIHKMLTLSEN